MGVESILIWILLGAVAGWLAGQLYKGSGFGLFGNIVVGILGSFLGGWLGHKMGVAGATTGGFSLASILTAVVGAVVLLFIIGLLKRK
ncbi:MAG TPA: GlsB/YeaQ/YmgE family stress response membrane protein [Saprospiraceae bacterium]|nr:GlsB/YeaQ/YmgE family stress response membrane protein [Saprospiraceae bacterium]MCB9271860.1 GlsB/YeaQ/YmgE family stress response membrane protein [Lewinellaceae bacterium]HPG09044.1 GlsB/YeaQ/YmgE family stress response membrane protein [Saprospiraceae bacterium]HPQ99792.1 GlsB/YeaQ/YmgE family stress response membrane protein [Saprospiraceae bacterium]HQU53014.1 GlsB/YeaQ/YmgE family stress response membrane protein [Saprospiraceae bacterium]